MSSVEEIEIPATTDGVLTVKPIPLVPWTYCVRPVGDQIVMN